MHPSDIFFDEPWRQTRTTTLYSIPPEGVDTSEVESLSSYVLRLPVIHRMSGNQFRRLAAEDPTNTNAPAWGWRCQGDTDYDSIVLTEGKAPIVLESLARLTLRTDLHQTCFADLTHLFSNVGLISKQRRYCPSCINEDLLRQAPLYERLYWRCKFVVACPIHHIRLRREVCGAARRKNHVFNRLSSFGNCRACGAIGYRCASSAPADIPASDDEIWRANQIRSALGSRKDLSSITLARARASLKEFASSNAGGMKSLSRASSCHQGTLSEWCRGVRRLSMATMLNVCSAMGWDLADWLRGQPVQCHPPWQPTRPRVLGRRRVNKDELEQELRRLLQLKAPPKRYIGPGRLEASTARKYFPDLCKEVVQVAARERARLRTLKVAKTLADAEHVVRECDRRAVMITLPNAKAITGQNWFPNTLKGQLLLALRQGLAGITPERPSSVTAEDGHLIEASLRRLRGLNSVHSVDQANEC